MSSVPLYCNCISITHRIVQNLNIAVKKDKVKHKSVMVAHFYAFCTHEQLSSSDIDVLCLDREGDIIYPTSKHKVMTTFLDGN